MQNYLLAIPNDPDYNAGTIHDPKSKLKIKVFDTLNSRFTPSKGEVRFSVTSANRTIEFETEGYKKHWELLILQMISWYCIYLGLIEAQIHYNWPEVSVAH